MRPDLAAFAAAADASHVYTVKNRAERVAELYGRAGAGPSTCKGICARANTKRLEDSLGLTASRPLGATESGVTQESLRGGHSCNCPVDDPENPIPAAE